MTDFITEIVVNRVRKFHRCMGCQERILIGTSALKWVGVFEGQFGSGYYHPDCRQAEVAWNRMADTSWYEWYNLHEMEQEDYPWLRENYPDVAARLVHSG